jgi:hypothetical protein
MSTQFVKNGKIGKIVGFDAGVNKQEARKENIEHRMSNTE